jgi:hypothetical protein
VRWSGSSSAWTRARRIACCVTAAGEGSICAMAMRTLMHLPLKAPSRDLRRQSGTHWTAPIRPRLHASLLVYVPAYTPVPATAAAAAPAGLSPGLYGRACMHPCWCMYQRAPIHTPVYIHTSVHTHTPVCTHTHTHQCVHKHQCTHTHASVPVYIQRTYTHWRACTYTACTYICASTACLHTHLSRGI